MENIQEIKMREGLSEDKFYFNRFWWFSLFLSLILNGLGWFLIYWRIKPTELPIFLHYNIYFGIDLIGQWYQLYYYPAAGLLSIIINFLLAALVYRQQKVIMYFFSGATIVLQIFLGLLILLLVNLNL